MQAVRNRMEELAQRCARTRSPQFSAFLSPAEESLAEAAAGHAGVVCSSFGGYPDAERVMVCFSPEEEPAAFPLSAISYTWPHQENGPGHRDLLGAIMGLGIKRECVGDLVPEASRAWVFCTEHMASFLAENLLSAGKCHLHGEIVPELPQIQPPEGQEIRDTVMSPRLDAIVGAGFHLSRGNAAEIISSGKVKLDHIPNIRTDARVREGSVVSVGGMGRLTVAEIGAPNKKGRLPIRLIRYGKPR